MDIIDILQRERVSVSYHDPLIPYLKLANIDLKSVDLDRRHLDRFDCVVITCEHSLVDYRALLKNAKLIFDTRNIYKNVTDKKIHKL